jgi:AP endonuclease-2
LHDEIIDANGHLVKLQDVLGVVNGEVPRIASKHWVEHSGKQTLLQNFFGRKNSEQKGFLSITPSEGSLKPAETLSPELSELTQASPSTLNAIPLDLPFSTPPNPSQTQPESQSSKPLKLTPTLANNNADASTSKANKRKLTTDTLTRTSSKKQKQHQPPEKTPGQSKLSTFFAKPKASPSSSPAPTALTSRQKSKSKAAEHEDVAEVDLEADYEFAVLLSQESNSSQQPTTDSAESKQAWSSLLAPIQAPKCTVHGETAKEMTVGKPGPNKGKKFFICPR